MRKHRLGDVEVIVDDVALGVAISGPEHLVQVGQLECSLSGARVPVLAPLFEGDSNDEARRLPDRARRVWPGNAW